MISLPLDSESHAKGESSVGSVYLYGRSDSERERGGRRGEGGGGG